MAKVKLELGATMDFLSPDDFSRILDEARVKAEETALAQARGKTWFRFPKLQGSASGGVLSLGTQQFPVGPKDGFVWQIRRLCVSGLATGDVVGMYVNTTQDPPEWTFSAAIPNATFSKSQMTIREGGIVFFQNIGTFTSTAQINVVGEVVEIPTIMIGKEL